MDTKGKNENQIDYFERQVIKYSKFKATDDEVTNSIKEECIKWRKLISVIQDFKEERGQFERHTLEEMPNSNFSHKMVCNEMQDTSDRV